MADFAAPYNALIAANMAPPKNPLTSGLTDLAQTSAAISGAQTAAAQADDAELANAQNHIGMVISGLSAALRKGPDVTERDVHDAAADLVAQSKGRVSSQEVAGFTSQLSGLSGPQIYQALQAQQYRLLSAQDRIATMRGQTNFVSTGGKTSAVHVDGFTGQPRVVGQMTNTMSPAEAASPVPGPVDPRTGAGTSITAGERAESAGLAPSGTYTGQGGGAIPVTIDRSGRITRSAPQPATSASPVPPAGAPGGFGSDTTATMPAAPRGPIQTQPSPAQDVALKAAGDQYAAAGQNQATYAQQMQQLQSALTGLQGTNTGPGTESRQAIASYMLALPGGIGRYLPGVDPKSIAAYDEANKYLTQTAQGSPNATRSDAGLNTALASSPSVHISNAAAQDVLKANIGFRRAEMASYAAFQKTGQDPGEFPSWLAQRQQQIDPRAYTVDMMSPAQRQSFIGSLSPAAKTKFLGTVRDAISSGMIDPTALRGGTNG